jgi:kynureninase
MQPQSLYDEPNALAPHYSQFRVSQRCLLTGHSHQAWPDQCFDGQQRAWQDAAHYVDEKWGPAFEQAELVRAGFRRLLGDDPEYGAMALGQNTHELLIRFLSALPLRERPHIVTTDGEFHSMRRQLNRLEEEGLVVTRVAALPADTLAQRVAEALDHRTAAVTMSAVLFGNGHIVPGLDGLSAACRRRGIPLLVDAYHALNVVPFSLREHDLLDAYVVGGGYKYCQLGEGNCFLRFPAASLLRPAVTGWFAEFADLTAAEREARVAYGEGDVRFAGATYDPTSHYRAADVFAFFEERALSPDLLREVSQHQVGLLARSFDALDADSSMITRDRSVPITAIGGFLALKTPHAAKFQEFLRERDVWTDYRAEVLRLGPAPYLSDRQLIDAVEALAETIEVVRSIV